MSDEVLKMGLSENEVYKKLKEFGPNILPEKREKSVFLILINQLKSPLVYVLLAASFITSVLGHFFDTTIILLAVFINTILGFLQEEKADRALSELKKLVVTFCEVIRDGEKKTVSSEDLVPGDIVVLSEGSKIPADGIIVESNRFFVNEASLTGESVLVSKIAENACFMGTFVVSGKAFMRVTETGANTQMGEIAGEIKEIKMETPLTKQMKVFSHQLTVLVLFLTVLVFIVGVITGQSITDIFVTVVALAVSAIPEGLLVGLTVVLAIGMQRILKKKGLVRNLVSAETLGGVTVICTDKTGTLTKGQMQVVSHFGNKKKLALQSVVANDLDDPIVIAGFNWAKKFILDISSKQKKYIRIDSIPFSSKDRFFASLNSYSKDENIIFVNGAPEFLVSWSNLSENAKSDILIHINELTSQGMRVIGMARKKVKKSYLKLNQKDIKTDLEWVGLLALSDPIRTDVKKSFQKAFKAGILPIVITGDYKNTAISIMKKIGIEITENEIIEGAELKNMNEALLRKKLSEGVKLFARTTPNQKLKIVDALQKNCHVVAMMGDGVNDAPALKKADIGIVVGDATDVARESADLVLLNSSFATIIAAIEEGRGIFDNIRKIILYLMSDAFGAIITVLLTMFFALPIPLMAAQILWINLISDGFPHLALTIDPKAKKIMNKVPKDPQENLVTQWMREIIFIVSAIAGLSAFVLFYLTYKTTNNIELARSVAFATMGVNSLFYVFSIKTLKEPFWNERIFGNKLLNFAVLVGLTLQTIPFYIPLLRNLLGVVFLPFYYWIYIFVAAILMFFTVELMKVVLKN